MKNIIIRSVLAAIIMLVALVTRAQVGFNNPNPDPSSILDLTANDKGLLVPRMTTVQRQAIGSPAQSLLVFDTNLNGFFFYQGGTWYSLNEWVKAAGSSTATLNGNAVVNGSLSVSGFSTNALVPTGAILMWSGSIASIPTGWALCDGGNGTIDLRDRFIVAAGSAYSPGNVGGVNTVTLTASQIPAHNHSSGTLSTSFTGAHTHTVTGQLGGDNNDHNNTTTVGAGDKGSTETGFNFLHTSSSSGAHSHTISGSTGSTGSGGSHENRPPYYALAYIMKL